MTAPAFNRSTAAVPWLTPRRLARLPQVGRPVAARVAGV